MDGISVIKRQVFEISLNEGSKAFDLQNRISEIANGGLQTTLTKLIDKQCPNRLITIDTIVIDVGTIKFDDIEGDLVRKIATEFERALLRLAISGDAADSRSINQISRSGSETLNYFFLHGHLPWWVSSAQEYSLSDSLIYEIEQHKSAFLEMLKEAGKKDAVLKRIAYTFNDKVIKMTIKAIEPSNAEQVISYAEALDKKHQKEQLINADKRHFKSINWYIILNFLLNERGTYFNTRTFLKSVIRQMARHHNIEYLSLLTLLAEKFTIAEGNAPAELPVMIRSIYSEEIIARTEIDTLLTTPDHALLIPASEQKSTGMACTDIVKWIFEPGPSQADRFLKKDIVANLKLFIKIYGKQELITLIKNNCTAAEIWIRRYPVPKEFAMILIDAAGKHKKFIIELSQDLQNNYHSCNHLRLSGSLFSDAVWAGAFLLLIRTDNGSFNESWFTASLVTDLARQFNIDKAIWIQAILGQPLQPLKELTRKRLKEALPVNYQPDLIRPAQKNGLPTNKTQPDNLLVNESDYALILIAVLKSNKWPTADDIYEFNQLVIKALQLNADKYLLAIASLCGDLKIVKRFAVIINDEALTQMAKAKSYPGGIGSLLSYLPARGKASRNKQGLATKTFFIALYFKAISTRKTAVLSQLRDLVYLIAGDQQIPVAKLIHLLLKTISAYAPSESIAKGLLPYLNAINNEQTTLNKPEIQVTNKAAVVSDTAYIEEVLEAYLINGIIPWWSKTCSLNDLMQFITAGLKTRSGTLHSILSKHLAHTERVIRLIELSEKGQAVKLLAFLVPDREILRLYSFLLAKNDDELFNLSVLVMLLGTPARTSFLTASVSYLKSTFFKLSRGSSKKHSGLLSKWHKNALVAKRAGHGGVLLDAVLSMATEQKIEETRPKSANLPYRLAYNEETLIYLLKNYQLPPGADRPAIDEFLLFLKDRCRALAANTFINQFADESVIKNLSFHLTTQQLLLILDIISGNWSARLHKILTETRSLFLKDDPNEQTGRLRLYWVSSVTYLTQNKNITAQSYVRYLFTSLKPAQQITALINANKAIKASQGSFTTELGALIELLNEELKVKGLIKPMPQIADNKPPEPAVMTEEHGIYINNAGLVLLSPYLDRLLQQLRLLPLKNGPAGLVQTGKSLQLMHYLVTGKKSVREKDMVLNKLLLGLDISAIVPVNHKLTRGQTKLAELLLQSVIANWPVLGNTSIQGLRETFLIRNGKITHKDNAYHLLVEKKQFDMLVKHLPWPISILKNSRMPKPLHVTWI